MKIFEMPLYLYTPEDKQYINNYISLPTARPGVTLDLESKLLQHVIQYMRAKYMSTDSVHIG